VEDIATVLNSIGGPVSGDRPTSTFRRQCDSLNS
jgi:hypothetical protein